jgi:hypothetical protein
MVRTPYLYNFLPIVLRYKWPCREEAWIRLCLAIVWMGAPPSIPQMAGVSWSLLQVNFCGMFLPRRIYFFLDPLQGQILHDVNLLNAALCGWWILGR